MASLSNCHTACSLSCNFISSVLKEQKATTYCDFTRAPRAYDELHLVSTCFCGSVLRYLHLGRYLYETGEYEDALKFLDIAYAMFPQKTTLLYAHLCNSAAVILFEQNSLKKCEEMSSKAFKILSALLPEDDLELASFYHNRGQLEGVKGRQDEAMKLLQMAEDIRMKHEEEAIISLGLGHLVFGRALFNKGLFQAAIERYDKAEEIFVRTLGPISQFLAQ